ncbi:MAG: small basic protein [Phycisphaerales bacterium]|jgi:small basic protein (TIGR04137 family)|nr:small basic protein [Phycisphaerales bacterium]
MSLHRSLKTKPAGLNQHRNVLKRSERVAYLAAKGEFDLESDSPMGLVKVANRAVVTKKPKKEQAEETAEGGEGTEGDVATETE